MDLEMAGGKPEMAKDHRGEKTAGADEIRAILHGIRNPLAASRLELQLARRCEKALADALDSGDLATVQRELRRLIESLDGIEESVEEACARLDTVERAL